jgi:hypothetical protein
MLRSVVQLEIERFERVEFAPGLRGGLVECLDARGKPQVNVS